MGSTALWLALATVVVTAALLILTAFALARLWRTVGQAEPAAVPVPVSPPEPTDVPEPEHAKPPEDGGALDGDSGAASARAQAELMRARQLAALVGTLDLDELLPRVLEAATAASYADAAAVALRTDGETTTRTHNLTPEEVPPLDVVQAEPRARGFAIHYRYPGSGRLPQHIEPIASGLVVPLVGGSDVIGQLAVYWRGEPHEPSDDELAALEEFALISGRAIENARSYEQAQRLAVLDSLTGIYNRRFFYETLAREVKRAHRYDRSLAILVFDVDQFKAINDRWGHLAGDEALVEVAERLRSVVRAADVASRIGGDEFAVVLPEAALIDADQLFQRLQLSLADRPVGRIGRLRLSPGTAELQRDDDSLSLFQRADEALLANKRRGQRAADEVAAPEDELG
ncbi:MAG: sensor domain-containing diguanylate cyclase [Thermoleophilia bacterium]|nr:sensor domain-containing diguanylate cyclase [Thermoleophilia bacterium]